MPAHHLRIKPCGVQRLGARRVFAGPIKCNSGSERKAPPGAIRNRPLNVRSMISGGDADTIGASEKRNDLLEIVRVVDEIGRIGRVRTISRLSTSSRLADHAVRTASTFSGTRAKISEPK